MKNRWLRWSLAGDHRESSRSVIAKREGHDHQGQRVFGRGVRPRVDNSDHRGQRVNEGSALAVLYDGNIYLHLKKCVMWKTCKALGRYSTFQYADRDAYPEDFNADALFHVSVSVKRICLCLPFYKQCLHNIVIIHMKMQCLFIHNVVNSIFIIHVYTCHISRIRWADYGFDI